MKLTNETFRELYLEDLAAPDTTHDGRPKVRAPQQWRNVKTRIKAEPLVIDVHGPRNVWVWGDQHFGHKNIIKYTGRPYPDTDLMTQCLIGNYLNVVQPDDIVIFNGDIGFLAETKINEILDQLPGYKIHIVGNHDMHRDGKVYQLNVDEQHLCLVVDVPDHDFDYQLLFTHYPVTNIPPNCVNVHGHTHQHTLDPWNINVCVEHTNYAPLNLKVVMERARKYMETQV